MKTITFYSYKGGVGRSLALANISSRLAEFGKKVCILDLDLEAPGLHLKFPVLEKHTITNGIVDYIFEFTNSGRLHKNLDDYSIPFNLHINKPTVTLIPAGNIESKDYWKKLTSINWFNLLYENEKGLPFFLDLKQKIKTQFSPDFLLIDSRTGISDISGITLSLLADEIIVLAANNKENLRGTKKIIDDLRNPELSIMGNTPKVHFVLSRIPFTERPSDKIKEQNLISKIKREYHPTFNEINIIHSDRDLEENEQLKIGYEKDDSTTQISKDYLDLFETITKDDLTKDEKVLFKNLKESEKYFSKALVSESPKEKIELLNKAIELNPNNLELYFQRMASYNDIKDYPSAISDCDFLLSLDENNTRVILFKAFILDNSNLREEAISYFHKVMSLDDKNNLALWGMGIVESAKGNFIAAIDFFSKAITLDPDSSIFYNSRADSYRQNKEYNLALEDAFKALELDPTNALAYGTLAEIYLELKKMNEFYLHFELALKFYQRSSGKNLHSKNKSFIHLETEERFKNILERYQVTFTTSENDVTFAFNLKR